MHTVTIEILRTGESHNFELSKQRKYIALCGSYPHVDLSIDCEQATFSKYKKKLRYFDSDERQRQEGIRFFEQLLTKIFDDLEPLRIEGQTEDWLHLRLVISPRELAQLPFEIALTPKGFRGYPLKRFLLNPQRLTTLTREVRQVGPLRYNWPYKPRILFVWADPCAEVPHREHSEALIEIVKHFAHPIKNNAEPIPDLTPWFTILRKASLKSLKNEVKSAIKEGNPFTHIHLLAHGNNPGADEDEAFKLILHDDENPSEVHYANGEELAISILATDSVQTFFPAIVTLIACDSSNEGSISLPAGSLAQQLHQSGVPCVLASQFPLSVEGSVKLVSTLYQKLLINCDDPRIALYQTRNDLFNSNIHDWASLVAYIRFPEDINEQLKDNHLKILLHALKTANAWSDHVLQYKDELAPERNAVWFKDVGERLDKAIKDLEFLLKTDIHQKKERFAEHYGLLGSAFKRKAEHLFRMADILPEKTNTFITESKKALAFSREWYFRGYDKQKNHWTAVQFLSLSAIINGSLTNTEERDIWTIAKIFAETDAREINDPITRIWAWGTLAELCFLSPLKYSPDEKEINTQAKEEALNYLKKIFNAQFTFIDEIQKIDGDIKFAQDSTLSQFKRYVDWWPKMIPSPSIYLLKEMAKEIFKELNI